MLNQQQWKQTNIIKHKCQRQYHNTLQIKLAEHMVAVCAVFKNLCLLLQFMVDISTPASVIDSISQAVRAHMDANPLEFKIGSAAVSFSSNGDPLKVQLVVGFEFSHNGMPPCRHDMPSPHLSHTGGLSASQ